MASNSEVKQASQARPRASQLESLPAELLLAVLSASPSTDDLHSLLRASPVAYRVFLPAKRAVLISLLTRELGSSGLRAGIASTLRLQPGQAAMQELEALHRGEGGALSTAHKDLPEEIIFKLVQANRDVQFLVNEFERTRRPAWRHIRPGAAHRLTPRERRRLATALFWHHFLMSIGCGQYEQDDLPQWTRLLGLFQPWESHQVVDAHCFVFTFLHEAFMMCVCGYIGDNCPIDTQYFEGTEQEDKMHDLACDLGALRRKLEAEPGADRAQPRSLAEPSCDDLYASEDAAPTLESAGDDDDNNGGNDGTGPPFAWVDGNGGRDCRRWGTQLPRHRLPPGQQETMTFLQYRWLSVPLQRWRWLGFAFLDRARVERLKEDLPEYETGWLTRARPPDEECNRTENDWGVVETDDEYSSSDQDCDAIESGEGEENPG
ncbi:hypothetical protein PG984_000223 [Apiospora sp. TS-2023a]